jgi:predicted deacylase
MAETWTRFSREQNGSASRFAYHMLTEVMPLVDYAVDFHAGGASRFNALKFASCPNNPELITLANVLMPRLLYSLNSRFI